MTANIPLVIWIRRSGFLLVRLNFSLVSNRPCRLNDVQQYQRQEFCCEYQKSGPT